MDSLLFAINAVAPIIIMVAIGYILKKLGFMNVDFAGKLNKIVFRLLLPAMLFLNVYKINSIKTINGGFIIYTLIATLVIFVLSVPLVILITRDNKKRGPLLLALLKFLRILSKIP